jgi:hypothetical protein
MEQNGMPGNKSTHIWLIIFNKDDNNSQWEMDSLLNKWYWENWIFTYKRTKQPYLMPY